MLCAHSSWLSPLLQIQQAPPDPEIIVYHHTCPKHKLETKLASLMAEEVLCKETARPPTKEVQKMKLTLSNAPAGFCCSVFVVAVEGEGDDADDGVDEKRKKLAKSKVGHGETVEERKECDESNEEHQWPWFRPTPSGVASWLASRWTLIWTIVRCTRHSDVPDVSICCSPAGSSQLACRTE